MDAGGRTIEAARVALSSVLAWGRSASNHAFLQAADAEVLAASEAAGSSGGSAWSDPWFYLCMILVLGGIGVGIAIFLKRRQEALDAYEESTSRLNRDLRRNSRTEAADPSVKAAIARHSIAVESAPSFEASERTRSDEVFNALCPDDPPPAPRVLLPSSTRPMMERAASRSNVGADEGKPAAQEISRAKSSSALAQAKRQLSRTVTGLDG